jgi:two-component system sensor histidine kinase SenX3
LDRIALLAHQLRTPLAAINALAQGLMRRGGKLSSEEIQDRAEKIWRASLRLDELIETILSYTRASTGAIVPNVREFSPADLIQRVCREQGSPEPARPFQLDLQHLPATMVGDPVLLEQALVIILSNAMKYSSPDSPISVGTRTSHGTVRITVKDQGIGVSKQDLPFLMQPFFRGKNAKKTPGTGLGLSLAWQLLKLHGGTLEIDSQEGHGTTVTIVLPEANGNGLNYSI